jgi:2-dehydropantoate 2-reductase
VGAGSIGLLYAGRLSRACPDGDVVLATRRREAVHQLTTGWDIVDHRGRVVSAACPVNLIEGLPASSADVIIMATAIYDVASAARRAAPSLADPGLVITLQNGVNAGELISDAFLGQPVAQGATTFGATAGRRSVRVTKSGETILPAIPGIDSLVEALSNAELSPRVHPDVHAIVWGKTALAVASLVSLVLDEPLGRAVRSPNVRDIAEKASREIIQVANAMGVRIEVGEVLEQLAAAWAQLGEDAEGAVLTQFRSGRQTEVAARLEPILSFAATTGVPTPVLTAIYDLALARQEFGRRGQAVHS